MSKDFHVTVRVKNGRIIRRMREMGIKSVADLSRISGATQQVIGNLILFKRRPHFNGDWIDAAYSISSALQCEPEDLWPEHIAALKARSGSISFDADIDEVQAIAAQIEKSEFLDRASLPKLLGCLTARERKVVAVRFGLDGGGEATLGEIGDEMGVSGSRVRKIEAKAIRKMVDTHRRSRLNAEHNQIKAALNG